MKTSKIRKTVAAWVLSLVSPLAFTSAALGKNCELVGGEAAIDIKKAFIATGADFLGEAVSNHLQTPAFDGCYRHFAGGSIYWYPGGEAHEVHGDIRWKWSLLGWEQSSLGFPVTDETSTPDRVGRFNHFQGGSIYWKPNLSAHSVMNGFRTYWANNGWERNSALGYPINDEMPSFPIIEDRYQDFENGVLYLKNSSGVVSEIWPFPLASKSKDDLEPAITEKLDSLLADAGDSAYRDSSLRIVGTDDYSLAGPGAVLNRGLVVQVRIKYKAAFLGIDGALPDPYSDLTLKIRIDGRRRFSGDAEIYSVIFGWNATTTVPYPTRIFKSPVSINEQLRGVLDPLVGKETELGILPEPFTLLSAKITTGGDLAVYVAPLD